MDPLNKFDAQTDFAACDYGDDVECLECGAICDDATGCCYECDADQFMDEHDGQPTEYEEWQDLYGGDDWDFGQFDDC